MSALANVNEPTPPTQHRTWPQRLTIIGIFACALLCFIAAGGLYAGQRIVEDRNNVEIDSGAAQTSGDTNLTVPADDVEAAAPANDDGSESEPVETFPPADPGARNFLITGADNNSCIDPDSPYAPAFGDRANLGERSDTIMMWRVDPSTSQVAVLSFPRDLWVTVAGRQRKDRINAAYQRDAPQRLIDTIYANFEVPTDHFVQVDFCAFKTLVDAVGGVAVPFETPVRDPRTGLNVPEAGCFTFDGDHALAYVRSRRLQTFTEANGWQEDGTSDLGRISRQQDFLRRTVSSLLSKGAYNPDVAGGLIETSSEHVVVDSELTPGKMLEFAGVLRSVDPAEITTYQIEASPQTIQGNAVLVPRLEGDNMQAILAVFRGEATLGGAPDQVFSSTTTSTSIVEGSEDIAAPADSVAPDATAAEPTDDVEPAPETTPEVVPATTLPTVEADQNTVGVVPDSSVSC